MKSFTIAIALLVLGISTTRAQSQRFKVTIENVGAELPVLKKGIFETPIGEAAPAPIGPGQMYQFSFTAGPGNHLSFASMFFQSNDLFYSFEGAGLALYDETGVPISGDVTDQIFLYDAGTEVNEEPGVGENQAPRQTEAGAGAVEGGGVARIDDGAMDAGGFTYPNAADIISVSIEHDGSTGFTVTIENVSTENILMTSVGAVSVPLSPGIWVVHSDAMPFFTPNEAAPAGIEAIAEDGNPLVSDAELDSLTGVQVPLSPGAWAVHDPSVSFFTAGDAASAGIEAIAEDGNPAIQAAALSGIEEVAMSGVFNTPAGSESPGPLGPGGSYTFLFDAMPGENLSFATMYVQSNDIFYAPDGAGIALFNDSKEPLSGEITGLVGLWDAGTEVDEEPGVGLNQAPRQSGPNTGVDEAGVIAAVESEDDGYAYPEVSEIVRITITPLEAVPFYVWIENVGAADAVASEDGMGQAVPLSPGVWAVHDSATPFFTEGESDRGDGLEGIAEDGDPTALAASLKAQEGILSSGVFDTPMGADAPAPLLPGNTYPFQIEALPGEYLSFATMFVQSNDLFYAPDSSGIALFDEEGNPRRINVTHYVRLWDAGTEANEEPGLGANQAPRQAAPDTGDDENGVVVPIADGEMGPGGFTYPATTSQIRVTIAQAEPVSFRVLVENVSNENSVAGKSAAAVPLSPGAWAVHTAEDPFFTSGAMDRGEGLETLAEDGDPDSLSKSLPMLTGVITSGVFNTPINADAPSPVLPGEGYEFTVYAVPGDNLSLATMFVQSNDLFYAPEGPGIALFDENGMPIDGEVTSEVLLWDAGTEVNQEPGIGADQAPRQSGPNTGADEAGPVVLIADGQMGPGGFTYPNVAEVIQVTVNGGTAVANEPLDEVPGKFRLIGNYPNPFNPTTTIRYEIDQPGEVSLTVFNMLGQKVADLVNGAQTAGVYEVDWDGRDAGGKLAASGVYLYRLALDGRQSTSRIMTLLK